ncbi:MAG TPA: serine/threonine-protein kinase [Polyangiaceae bacterium]
MHHPQSFPAGQVLAALPKALLLYLDARGGGAADEWLRLSRLRRDDLADETRTIPAITLRSALDAFVQVAAREDIEKSWPHLVAETNLGAWARVLRGSQAPEQSFTRLDGSESEYARSTRWETLDARAGFWRGRVLITHDPAIEEGGLLALMRAAELRAVPALFGYRPLAVRAEGVVAHEASTLAQTYEVRWSVFRAPLLIGALTAIGSGIGAPLLAAHVTSGAIGAATGLAIGFGIARDRLRRVESRAHSTRVHVLERSLELKEDRERAAAGQLEGMMVAGLYRIGQRMGAGAAGVIYQAQRVSDGLPVAIKLLRAAAAHESVAADRLRREAEALRLAWHPNIVEILDQGHLPDGTSYIVMELLTGESLAARLRNRGKLEEREVAPIGLQICDALVAVHAAGVVHRDLKPSNLILVKAPDGERVKVIDFGIARVEWEETRITNMGAPLGTPGYMSPEQENGGQIDARSDLFAVGAILYECLVGEPPPPVPSGLFHASLDKGSRSTWQQVPEKWRSIIDKAMAPAPENRFQDARSFTQAIRNLEAPKRASGASS